MGTGFLLGEVKMFGSRLVVMVARCCECAQCH